LGSHSTENNSIVARRTPYIYSGVDKQYIDGRTKTTLKIIHTKRQVIKTTRCNLGGNKHRPPEYTDIIQPRHFDQI
jgi:hypothetical protein